MRIAESMALYEAPPRRPWLERNPAENSAVSEYAPWDFIEAAKNVLAWLIVRPIGRSTDADCLVRPEDYLHAQVEKLVEQVKNELQEDIAEARQAEGLQIGEAAINACLRMVRRAVPHLALASCLKLGAFLEETRELSFVVQSLITDRRFNCRISPDGASARVIRLDEKMQAISADFNVDDPNGPRELAEWVTKRD